MNRVLVLVAVAGGEDEPVRGARARGEAPAAGPSFARLSTAKVAQDDRPPPDYDALHLGSKRVSSATSTGRP